MKSGLIPAAQSPVLVINCEGHKFEVWDLSAAEPSLRCDWSNVYHFHDDNIQAVAITPDGRTVLTGHLNNAVRFLDVSGSKAVEQQPLNPNPVLSATGARMLSLGPFVLDDLLLSTTELGQPAAWQVADAKLTERPAPSVDNQSLGYLLSHSGDGRFLAVTWSRDSQQDVAILARHGERFEPVQRIVKGDVQSAALNHDGTRLAIGSSSDNVIELWGGDDAQSPKQKLAQVAVPFSRCNQLTFLDDQTLVSRGDSRIQIWDIQPTAITLRVELPEQSVGQFAISPDGHTLATGGGAGGKCWDLRSSPPQLTASFPLPLGNGAVAFSPDGRHLAAAYSSDGSPNAGIDLIDLATGLSAKRLTFPGIVRNITYTPDGRHLAVANGNSTIYVVRLPPNVATSASPVGDRDPDRRAAEWVLSIGGTISIKENDQERSTGAVGDLPRGVFELALVGLGQNPKVSDVGLAHFKDCKNLTTLYLEGTQVSDVGLAHFKNCTNLTFLSLWGTEVSDAGLVHFKDCKNLKLLSLRATKASDAGLVHFKNCQNLTNLSLGATQVSDAGLAHFKDCKNLSDLDLSPTQVSDAGLAHFKDCKNLTWLRLNGTSVSDMWLKSFGGWPKLILVQVKNTKVTEAGVKKLSAALPGCKIEWDGGVIEPSPSTNPDRRAAERVAALRSNDPNDLKVVAMRDELLVVTRQQPGSAAAQEAAILLTRLPSLLDTLRREHIPPYELKAAGFGDPNRAPTELVAILGDSRFRAWDTINSIVLSPDERTLASGGSDRTVAIWDMATGEARRFLPHTNPIWSVLFSRNGEALISAEERSGKINIWDTATGRPARPPLAGGNRLALSHDDEILVSGSDGGGGEVQIRNWKTGEVRHSLKGHTNSVRSVAISPDGTLLASGSSDGTARICDVATGRERHILKHIDGGFIRPVAFSHDGRRLATATNESGGVKLWSTETGELETTFGNSGYASVAFSGDGKYLAAGHYSGVSITVWDLKSQKEHLVIKYPSGSTITSLRFSGDNRTLAAGGSGFSVRFWDVATGVEKNPRSGHSGFVTHMALSPDGHTLATAGHEGKVVLWNLLTRDFREIQAGLGSNIYAIAINPIGNTLATAHGHELNPEKNGGYMVKLWDIATGQKKHTLLGHQNGVLCVTFSPDGKRLASGSYEGEAKVWDVETGIELGSFTKAGAATTGVAFSPDGKTLGVVTRTGNEPTTVRILDARTGDERQSFVSGAHFSPYGSSSISFHPNGSQLAATGWSFPNTPVKLWDLTSGDELRTFREGWSWVVFTPDGSRLISVGPDASIKFWNPNPPAGRPLLEKTIHLRPEAFRNGGGWIEQLILAPDGRHLFSLNSNGTVYVLRLNEQP